MPGIARQGIDTAIGSLIEGSSDVIVNNAGAVRVGDAVAGHYPFVPPHDAPTMSEGSDSVVVNGIPVCRAGDMATCGDAATGSDDVVAG